MPDWTKPFAVSIMLTVLCVALWAMTLYYLIGFKKGKKENKYKAYYFDKKLLITSFILLVFDAIFSITSIALVFLREETYGLKLMWVFNGLTIAVLLAEMIFSWLTYQYLFIGLEEEKIQFWGEKVLSRKIVEIVKLEEQNRLFIFFKYGERNLRKEKLVLKTNAANFLIENLNLLNFKILDEISESTKELMNKKDVSEKTDVVVETKDKILEQSSTDNKIKKTAEKVEKTEKPKTKKVDTANKSENDDKKQEENKK